MHGENTIRYPNTNMYEYQFSTQRRGPSDFKVKEGVNATSLALYSNPLSMYSAYTMQNMLTPGNIQQWTSVTDKQIYQQLQSQLDNVTTSYLTAKYGSLSEQAQQEATRHKFSQDAVGQGIEQNLNHIAYDNLSMSPDDIQVQNWKSVDESEDSYSDIYEKRINLTQDLIQHLNNQQKSVDVSNDTSKVIELSEKIDKLLLGEEYDAYDYIEKKMSIISQYNGSLDATFYESFDSHIPQDSYGLVKAKMQYTLQNTQVHQMVQQISNARQHSSTNITEQSSQLVQQYNDNLDKKLIQYLTKFPKTITNLTQDTIEQLCDNIYNNYVQTSLYDVKSLIDNEFQSQSQFQTVQQQELQVIQNQINQLQQELRSAELKNQYNDIIHINQMLSQLNQQFDKVHTMVYTTQHTVLQQKLPTPAFSLGLTLEHLKRNFNMIQQDSTEFYIHPIRLTHADVIKYIDQLFKVMFQKQEQTTQKDLISNYIIMCEWISQVYNGIDSNWYQWFAKFIRPQMAIIKQLSQYKVALKETMNQRSLLGIINVLNFAEATETDFHLYSQPQPTQLDSDLLYTCFCGQLDKFFQNMSEQLQIQRQPVPSLSCKLQRASQAIHFDDNFIPDLEGLQQAILQSQTDMYYQSIQLSKNSAVSDRILYDELNMKHSLHHAVQLVKDLPLIQNVIDSIFYQPAQFRLFYEVFITQCSITTRHVMLGLNTQKSQFYFQLKQNDALVFTQFDNDIDIRFTNSKVFIKSLGVMYDMACVFLSVFTHRFDKTTKMAIQSSNMLLLQCDVAEIILRKSLEASDSAMIYILDNTTIFSKLTGLHQMYKVPYSDPITGISVNYQIAKQVNFSNQNGDIIRNKIFESLLQTIGLTSSFSDADYYYEFQAKQDTYQVLNRGGLCNGILQNLYAMTHLRLNSMNIVASSDHLSSCIAGNYFSLAEIFYTDSTITFKVIPQMARGRKDNTVIQGPLGLQDIIEEFYTNQSSSIDQAVRRLISTAKQHQGDTYDWQSKMITNIERHSSVVGKGKMLYTLATMNVSAGRTNFVRLQMALLVTRQSIRSAQHMVGTMQSFQNELNSQIALDYIKEYDSVESFIRAAGSNQPISLTNFNKFLHQKASQIKQEIQKSAVDKYTQYPQLLNDIQHYATMQKIAAIRQMIIQSTEEANNTLTASKMIEDILKASISETMLVNDQNRRNYMANIINQSTKILSLMQYKLKNSPQIQFIQDNLIGQIILNMTDRNSYLTQQSKQALDNIQSLYTSGTGSMQKLIDKGMQQLESFERIASSFVDADDQNQISVNVTNVLRQTIQNEGDMHEAILALYDSKTAPLGDMGRCSTLFANLFMRNKHLRQQITLMQSLNEHVKNAVAYSTLLLASDASAAFQNEILESDQNTIASVILMLSEDNGENIGRMKQKVHLMETYIKQQDVLALQKRYNLSNLNQWILMITGSLAGLYLIHSHIKNYVLRKQFNVQNMKDIMNEYLAKTARNMYYQYMQYVSIFKDTKNELQQMEYSIKRIDDVQNIIMNLIMTDRSNPDYDILHLIGHNEIPFDFGGQKKHFAYQSASKRSVTQHSSFEYMEQLQSYGYSKKFSTTDHINLIRSVQPNLNMLIKTARQSAETLTDVGVITQPVYSNLVEKVRYIIKAKREFYLQITQGVLLTDEQRNTFESEVDYIKTDVITALERLDSVFSLLPEHPTQFLNAISDQVFTAQEKQEQEYRYLQVIKKIQATQPTLLRQQEIEESGKLFRAGLVRQSFVASSIGFNDPIRIARNMTRIMEDIDINKDENIVLFSDNRPGRQTAVGGRQLTPYHSFMLGKNTTIAEPLSQQTKNQTLSFIEVDDAYKIKNKILPQQRITDLSQDKQMVSFQQSQLLNIGMTDLYEIFGGFEFYDQIVKNAQPFVVLNTEIPQLSDEMIKTMVELHSKQSSSWFAKTEVNVAYQSVIVSSVFKGSPSVKYGNDEVNKKLITKFQNPSNKDDQILAVLNQLYDINTFDSWMDVFRNKEFMSQMHEEYRQPESTSYTDLLYTSVYNTYALGKQYLNDFGLIPSEMFVSHTFYDSTINPIQPNYMTLSTYENMPYITVGNMTFMSTGTFVQNAIGVNQAVGNLSSAIHNQIVDMQQLSPDADLKQYTTSTYALLGLIGIAGLGLARSMALGAYRKVYHKLTTEQLINHDAQQLVDDHSQYIYHQETMPSEKEANKVIDLLETAVRYDERQRIKIEDLYYTVFNNFLANYTKKFINGAFSYVLKQSLGLDSTTQQERVYIQSYATNRIKIASSLVRPVNPKFILDTYTQVKSLNLSKIQQAIVNVMDIYKDLGIKDHTFRQSLYKQIKQSLSRQEYDQLTDQIDKIIEDVVYKMDLWNQGQSIEQMFDLNDIYKYSKYIEGRSIPAIFDQQHERGLDVAREIERQNENRVQILLDRVQLENGQAPPVIDPAVQQLQQQDQELDRFQIMQDQERQQYLEYQRNHMLARMEALDNPVVNPRRPRIIERQQDNQMEQQLLQNQLEDWELQVIQRPDPELQILGEVMNQQENNLVGHQIINPVVQFNENVGMVLLDANMLAVPPVQRQQPIPFQPQLIGPIAQPQAIQPILPPNLPLNILQIQQDAAQRRPQIRLERPVDEVQQIQPRLRPNLPGDVIQINQDVQEDIPQRGLEEPIVQPQPNQLPVPQGLPSLAAQPVNDNIPYRLPVRGQEPANIEPRQINDIIQQSPGDVLPEPLAGMIPYKFFEGPHLEEYLKPQNQTMFQDSIQLPSNKMFGRDQEMVQYKMAVNELDAISRYNGDKFHKFRLQMDPNTLTKEQRRQRIMQKQQRIEQYQQDTIQKQQNQPQVQTDSIMQNQSDERMVDIFGAIQDYIDNGNPTDRDYEVVQQLKENWSRGILTTKDVVASIDELKQQQRVVQEQEYTKFQLQQLEESKRLFQNAQIDLDPFVLAQVIQTGQKQGNKFQGPIDYQVIAQKYNPNIDLIQDAMQQIILKDIDMQYQQQQTQLLQDVDEVQNDDDYDDSMDEHQLEQRRQNAIDTINRKIDQVNRRDTDLMQLVQNSRNSANELRSIIDKGMNRERYTQNKSLAEQEKQDNILDIIQHDTKDMMEKIVLLQLADMATPHSQLMYGHRMQVMKSLVQAEIQMKQGGSRVRRRLRKRQQKKIEKANQPMISKKLLNDMIKSNARLIF